MNKVNSSISSIILSNHSKKNKLFKNLVNNFLKQFGVPKIRVDMLIPKLCQIKVTNLMDDKLCTRDTEDDLLRAFEAFDPERKGMTDVGILKQKLMNEGECFTEEEFEGL